MSTPIDSSLSDRWAMVRGQLRDEFGDTAFRSWLKPLTLKGLEGNCVRMSIQSRFMRDWINSHYSNRISELWTKVHPEVRTVEISIDQTAAVPPNAGGPAAGAFKGGFNGVANGSSNGTGAAPRGAFSGTSQRNSPPPAPAGFTGTGERESQLDPRYNFEQFVVGKPNELAHAAAQRVAESPTVPFNPLFLYGGVGLGKTHLMHAIAWKIKEDNPERRVLYLSAENFMYDLIRALRHKDTMSFKERIRSVDVLMVDDVQFFSGKDSTQEEFFHTFNDLVNRNKQLVISADKSPSDLEGLEERLRSRLGWGLVADIHPMTYELRLGVLQQKADAIGIHVPFEVLEFIATRISSNARELEGALNKLVAHATMMGRDITMDLSQTLLRDLVRANERKLTIEEIKKTVASHFNLRYADMESARRARPVARPRQIAMYLAKQLTPKSLPEIGRMFGNRDHTTVMYSVKKVEELYALDRSFAEDVDLLRKKLEP